MKGKLFVISTPIGNLADITYRAVETLNSVAFVLCEDTRVSSVLMRKYNIKTPLVSYRDQNHEKMFGKIIEKLDMGLNLGLISDAGTPLISDPGYKVVSDLKEKGYSIIPIPGVDAVTTAVSVSGLPTDKYTFIGFLPKSDSKRIELLKQYGSLESTVCIYESPNRLVELLKLILETLGDRTICVANDMTKMFEEINTGKCSVLLKLYEEKTKIVGEFVVLIAKE